MAVITLAGLLRDGSAPAPAELAQPVPERIDWVQAEDGQILIHVTRADGTDADLTGCALVLTVRPLDTAGGDPLLGRQAVLTAPETGDAVFTLSAADTQEWTPRKYRYDVTLIDQDDKRSQVVPEGPFVLDPAVSEPDDELTEPTPSVPLATGPAWLSFAQQVDFETDGSTDEQIIDGGEFAWDFDLIGPLAQANLFGRLAAIASVSGGNGTLRVRAGGTLGVADGAVLIALSGITGTSETLLSTPLTVARPSGVQLVKVTAQNSDGGQTTTVRGLTYAARSAP